MILILLKIHIFDWHPNCHWTIASTTFKQKVSNVFFRFFNVCFKYRLIVTLPSCRSQPQWSSTIFLQSTAPASSWSLKVKPREPRLLLSPTSHWRGAASCSSRPTRASLYTSPRSRGWPFFEPAAFCSCGSVVVKAHTTCLFVFVIWSVEVCPCVLPELDDSCTFYKIV